MREAQIYIINSEQLFKMPSVRGVSFLNRRGGVQISLAPPSSHHRQGNERGGGGAKGGGGIRPRNETRM